MKPRDRILDAAMAVFRRHGFRRSSIEQAAEAAGLTRQALYHHFKSKEALFRAVIERLHETALAAEIAAAIAAEKAGGGLADILVAGVTARLQAIHRVVRRFAAYRGAVLRTSHSRRATSTRNMPALYAAHGVATIERVCRKQRLALADGMTPQKLAQCVEMAINGAKSAHPGMQPADAFVDDLTTMARMLVAGAVTPLPKSPSAKPAAKKAAPKTVPKKPTRHKSGGRK